MTDEFAKNVLDFLAMRAGKDGIGHSIYKFPDNSLEYAFYVFEGVEDSYCTMPLKLRGTGSIIGKSDDGKCGKPYAVLLKHLLEFSKKGLVIYYGDFYDSVFLEANTTLENVLIEMDLANSSLETTL